MDQPRDCPRCGVCAASSHHWLPACEPEYDYECKHCDAIGNECPRCFGEGNDGDTDCDECDGEGVILIAGGQVQHLNPEPRILP